MDTDCIEHEGSRLPSGYGKVCKRANDPALPTVHLAHRWTWIQNHGEIPEGLVVRHKCDNPPCINVDHLELGTASDNQRDRVERGRFRNQNTDKSRCDKGHRLAGDNLYTYPSGYRACRTCRRKFVAEYRNKKKVGQ